VKRGDDTTNGRSVKRRRSSDDSSPPQTIVHPSAITPRKKAELAPVPPDLSTERKVAAYLSTLLPASSAKDNPAAALVPWVCDRLPSVHSRRAYARDLAAFVTHMREHGIDPLVVTGDHVRIYKGGMLESGLAPATVARLLSVLRGTYEQFGKRGLVEWETVQDIQAVTAPRVNKNTTPALSEAEARRLLHAPDMNTPGGIRDHALLFVFFMTACRCSAVANARVGHIERTDTDFYLLVREKGGKLQRKALLEAAPAVLRYLEVAGIMGDIDGPLFRPLDKDRRHFLREHMSRQGVWKIVKKYARDAGIHVDRLGGRGVGVHSLRKTALTNALEHGARMEQVQQLAGHSDIRTTQLYYQRKERDAEDAARHIQIR
jgi:site-specific recombinase XerD